MTTAEKTYGGQGAGERQAGRKERLRSSALKLIGAAGTTAVTINSVCGAAGLNKRYFYESYQNRDALLVDLLSSFFDDFYARTVREAQASSADVESRVREAVISLLGILEADPGIARLYAEADSEPGLIDVRTSAFEQFTGLFAAVADLEATDPQARFALFALVSGVTEALTHWLREDPPSMDREQVVTTSVRLCLAAIAVARDQ